MRSLSFQARTTRRCRNDNDEWSNRRSAVGVEIARVGFRARRVAASRSRTSRTSWKDGTSGCASASRGRRSSTVPGQRPNQSRHSAERWQTCRPGWPCTSVHQRLGDTGEPSTTSAATIGSSTPSATSSPPRLCREGTGAEAHSHRTTKCHDAEQRCNTNDGRGDCRRRIRLTSSTRPSHWG